MAAYKTITFDDRKAIAALYEKGATTAEISESVGVPKKTLYGELKRGDTGELDQNQRPAYDPVLALKTYHEIIRRRARIRKGINT